MYEYFDYRNTVFEWDEEKAVSNFIKHGIRFETASKVFADKNKLIRYDEEHPGKKGMMCWEKQERFFLLCAHSERAILSI